MPHPGIVDNISELSAIMKTHYGEGIEQQQNLAAMIYKRFGSTDVEFGGNNFEFPARMVQAQSVGSRSYMQSLPQPLANQDVTCRVRHRFLYASFDIAGPDMEKGKGKVDSFVNTTTDKMRSITESMLKDLNQQCYLDGSGVRATVTGAAVGNDIPVDTTQYLKISMQVNFLASDGVTLIGNTAGDSDPGDGAGSTFAGERFFISAIDAANNTVQISNAAGVVNPAGLTGLGLGDFIVRHKAIGTDLTGFDAIVDDGVANPGANVLQDIDRTASPLWRATVLDGTAGLTLQLLQLLCDIPEITSGRRIDMIVGSYNARDAYLQLLVPQKRFTGLKLDGGFEVLEYNGRDFLVDVDCQDDRVYGLNRASIKKFGLFDLKFVEQGGGILKHESLSGGDVFYGFMRAICNLGTTQANANAKIDSLPIDAAYQAVNR